MEKEANWKRILTFLDSRDDPICDDCLARALGIPHRQQVFSCCTYELARKIERERGPCSLCGKTKTVSRGLSGRFAEQGVEARIHVPAEATSPPASPATLPPAPSLATALSPAVATSGSAAADLTDSPQEVLLDGHSLSDIMASLAGKRPVFNSEADFQHALAWEIKSTIPQSDIRLEYRPRGIEERMYLDIWVKAGGRTCAIELKYKTRGLSVESNGEVFDLLDQSAQDIARYDVLKDVSRLERIVRAGIADHAVMIFLTNDQGYWKTPPRDDTIDAAFRLHEGRVIRGSLSWAAEASPGTTRDREAPLAFQGTYVVRWHDYSVVPSSSRGLFLYLPIPVSPEGQ